MQLNRPCHQISVTTRVIAGAGAVLFLLGVSYELALAGDRTSSRLKPESSSNSTSSSERSSTTERSSTGQARSGEQSEDRSSKSSTNSGEQGRTSKQSGEKGENSEGESKVQKSEQKSEKSEKSEQLQQQKSGEAKVPDTVAEWLQQILEPSKTPAVPTAQVTNPQTTVVPLSPATKTTKPAVRIGTPQLTFSQPELLAPNLSAKSLARALSLGFKPNGTSAHPAIGLGFTRLLAPDGLSADQARDLLKQALPDQGLEINQTYRIYRTATGSETKAKAEAPAAPMATPCGTDRCFGASAIKWQPQLSACARNVKIGVIDTAVDPAHLALTSQPVMPKSDELAATFGDRPRASNWHGTGVLALLAAGATSIAPGLIPDARYYLADIFTPDTNGAPTSDTVTLLAALNWLAKKDVNIINMSLAGPHDELLKTAIEVMSRKGIIFVAAVGNEGPTALPTFPSAYPQVIAVTAINKDLTNYRHAVRGDHVDVAAPGVGIWTAMPGGGGAYHSGTSFAVPFVTAAVAVIYGGLPAKTKAGALKRLDFVDLGAPGRDPIFGNGLLVGPSSCGPPDVTASVRPPLTAVNARQISSR
jgi:hypothetical protein